MTFCFCYLPLSLYIDRLDQMTKRQRGNAGRGFYSNYTQIILRDNQRIHRYSDDFTADKLFVSLMASERYTILTQTLNH